MNISPEPSQLSADLDYVLSTKESFLTCFISVGDFLGDAGDLSHCCIVVKSRMDFAGPAKRSVLYCYTGTRQQFIFAQLRPNSNWAFSSSHIIKAQGRGKRPLDVDYHIM
ncbi:hypothetical protein TWF106_008467 [Orbilia oligospora]|uniref:Uncharacterized protein n=1 Tax=Orbilia oligospora TaxID=2813651 RepID=A0A6G1MHW8_ORBOL|nr:hypothetical protein TWF106_008467 [Orbilia oligospora]KAF3258966.1 hypothetical protein TWF192_011100 [Orbilia oligospora]